ncbi:MAG: COX15/CtaA family protein [Hyphomicrobiaceae bacterium]
MASYSSARSAVAEIGTKESGEALAVRFWLRVVIVLVFAMIVVGGATRLTDSGLSITEWQPIIGAIPPLNQDHWLEAFEKYKQIPEYHQINKGMSLEAFKAIYWWEWSHRFLGRFIGLAFALPLLAFWMLGRIPRGMELKLLGVLALGGLQGAIGWYMVKSGLVDRVDVSHYRLALHLGTAFFILGLLVWLAEETRPRDTAIRLETVAPGHLRVARLLVIALFLQVLLGALVAGLKAGLTYNTWPLMDGHLIPNGLLTLRPWYENFFENVTTVQFDHRMMAYLAGLLALLHVFQLRGSDDGRVMVSAVVLLTAIIVQMGIGISTLLVAQGVIPIGLGLMHQGGAAIVFAIAVWHLHRISHSPARH